jgi:hypothetical protein
MGVFDNIYVFVKHKNAPHPALTYLLTKRLPLIKNR